MLALDELRSKVAEVIRTFPWYADLLSPQKIKRLADLPLLTDAVLEKHYYAAPVPGAAGVYETSKTSANKRKLVSYSAEDEARYLDIKTKRFADFLAGDHIKKGCIDVGVGHVCATTGIIFDRLGLEHITIDIHLPLAEHIRILKDFKPELLYAPPSLLDRILQVFSDPRIFGVRKIAPIGEVITENWAQKMAAAFGLHMTDLLFAYGSTETGPMATYSHEHGKYLLVDGVYAEALTAEEIDSSLGPLAADERILVITTFNRQFFPGLRYVTYDVVRGFEPLMVSGNEKQGFDCISRRVGTEYKHGERISIHDIENVVFQYVDRAVVRASVKNNRLTVGLFSKDLTIDVLKKINQSIQSAVPEIGVMIKSGLLDAIQVEQLDESRLLDTGAEKKKKIFHEMS